MKKILKFLLLTALPVFISSCVDSQRTVGDEYVVTFVEELNYGAYGTQYHVKASSTNVNANTSTFRGNEMNYYTNTLYSVGDTIKLFKFSKPYTKAE